MKSSAAAYTAPSAARLLYHDMSDEVSPARRADQSREHSYSNIQVVEGHVRRTSSVPNLVHKRSTLFQRGRDVQRMRL